MSQILADANGYSQPGKGSRLEKQICTPKFKQGWEGIKGFSGPATQRRLKNAKAPRKSKFLDEAKALAKRV